jgi:hypothetical protein
MNMGRSRLRLPAAVVAVSLLFTGAGEAAGVTMCLHQGHDHKSDVAADESAHHDLHLHHSSDSAAGMESHGTHDHGDSHSDACRILCLAVSGQTSPFQLTEQHSPELPGAPHTTPIVPVVRTAPCKPTESAHFLPFPQAPPVVG